MSGKSGILIRQNDLEDIRNDIQPKSTEEDEKKIKVQILDDEAKKIKKTMEREDEGPGHHKREKYGSKREFQF